MKISELTSHVVNSPRDRSAAFPFETSTFFIDSAVFDFIILEGDFHGHRALGTCHILNIQPTSIDEYEELPTVSDTDHDPSQGDAHSMAEVRTDS